MYAKNRLTLLAHKLYDKDIYKRYKDETITCDSLKSGIFDNLTVVTKSKFDNVVGYIKIEGETYV